MSRDKIFDDLSGLANNVAGLANDTLNTMREKADNFKKMTHAADEVEALSLKISKLEERVAALEAFHQPKKAKPVSKPKAKPKPKSKEKS